MLLAAGQRGFSLCSVPCVLNRTGLRCIVLYGVVDAMYCVLFMEVVDIAAICLKKTSTGDIIFAAQMTWCWQRLHMEQDARRSMVRSESICQ